MVWFRNDLRTHDNEILTSALEHGNRIVPVYCFDPRHYAFTSFGTRKTGALRAEFVRRNLEELKQTFKNKGGDLLTFFGEPEIVLPELCRKYQVDEVFHHREVAFEETEVSARVESALWKLGINLRHFIGHTLYHKEDLPFPIKDIPDSFSVFKKKTEREAQVRAQLPAPEAFKFHENLEDTDLPELRVLGFSDEEIDKIVTLTLSGGENKALKLMVDYLRVPSNAFIDSQLSPYIASGALSPNTFYHAILDAHQQHQNKKWTERLILNLMWRDYFRFMFKKHGNLFFQYDGFSEQAPQTAPNEEEIFEKWKNGETGEPLIDQSMKTLRVDGYLPKRMRLLVSAYLISAQGNWLKGAAWFEENLVDYGPSSNYGNWAHVAGVGSSTKENKPLDLQKLMTQV